MSRFLSGNIIEGMQVQALGTPAMSVIVGQGSCRIPTGTYPSSYSYFCGIDTTTGTPAGESVTIATAPTSNSRIDTIVAYVDLSVTPGTGTPNNPSMLKLMSVAGTVASSPSAPSGATIQSAIGASNPYIVLANIAVGTSVTQITNSNITDLRVMAGLSTKQVTNQYRFSAYGSASTTVAASGAATKIGLQTKLYDPSSGFDTTNSRYVATVPGVHHFSGAMQLFVVNGVIVQAMLYKNGSAVKNGNLGNNASGGNNNASSQVSGDISLAVGDYVELWATSTQASTSTTPTTAAAVYLDGFLVSP